jgi:SAM-dependent methyltransferase
VDAYVRSRPSYPSGLLHFLAADLGLAPDHLIVDVGSGTGILSELFLARGNRVVAVEPNRAMREAAEAAFGDQALFESVAGSAEETTLPDRMADFVVAGQAFHWFDPEKAATELGRVLKPEGWAVILWNHRRATGTPFLEAYEAFLQEWGTDYADVNPRHSDPQALGTFFRNGRFRERSFPNIQELDAAGLRARIESSSYMPGGEDPRFALMSAAVNALFDRHESGGLVHLEYDTRVFWGRL